MNFFNKGLLCSMSSNVGDINLSSKNMCGISDCKHVHIPKYIPFKKGSIVFTFFSDMSNI